MTAEREYRNQMIQYGRIFMLPEDQAIGALAEFNAAIAQGFIKTLTGVDVTIAPELVAEFILQAVIVVASDYGSELLQTFAYVEGALETNGITTCEGPDGPGKLADISDGKIPAPRLVGNYPNPFNPSTTISYVLPGVTHVTLKVYNMIGEEVVTLVDGVEAAGNKSVRWSAAGLASGVYLYRLQAGSYVSTGRMAFMQ